MMEHHHLEGYELTTKIGGGSFATVYKAIRLEDKIIVAVKAIVRGKHKKKSNEIAAKEIQLMRDLIHENIVRLYDFGYDSKNVYIVMEYCTEGDLAKLLREKHKLAEQFLLYLMQQLAAALKFLRGKDICHMDLKPPNILLTRNPNFTLKVADFGLSRIVNDENMESCRFAGSFRYMAPEKILNQKYDSKIDLWAVGIIMYECLVGRPFFQTSTVKTISDCMAQQKAVWVPPSVSISEKCEDLLLRLLKYNPAERISFEDFFNHEFLKLNYLPCPENYKLVKSYIIQATALETEKKYTDALVLCKKAISYLDGFTYTETNPEMRNSVIKRMQDYERYSKHLSHLAEKQAATVEVSVFTNDNQFFPLLHLCISTPDIKNALEIGRLAEMYILDNKRALALDQLTAALDLLIPLINNEPVGLRRNLLHKQIKKWLQLGESLKKSLNP